MIKSMTGFGRGSREWNGKKISVEIKCVNSKTLDMSCRWFGLYKEVENSIRSLIANGLNRGKIDVCVSVKADNNISEEQAELQTDKLSSAYHQVRQWIEKEGASPDIFIPTLLGKQDFWKTSQEVDIDEDELKEAEKEVAILIEQVIEQVNDFRKQEGDGLKKDLLERVKSIEQKLSMVDQYERPRIDNIRGKLEKALEELNLDWKKNKDSVSRLEEGMIYYLEKLDITEEKVRLSKHCSYFKECIEEESGGKKLAFISQEMGREINTLGSKANEVHLQKLVVEMKDELEKIKEQLFNIL